MRDQDELAKDLVLQRLVAEHAFMLADVHPERPILGGTDHRIIRADRFPPALGRTPSPVE